MPIIIEKIPISATEARNKASEVAKIEEKNEIHYIFRLIKERVNNGKFELYLNEGISDSIKEFFIRYGYKVETIDLSIETRARTIISW